MALLAEEIVEEWLNRNGFFTIRGIKVGVHEIDLLAVGFKDGETNWRHIEVQASRTPISYICALPKDCRHGRGPNNATKRSSDVISQGVEEWIQKKYLLPAKEKLRQKLYGGNWNFEFVVNRVKDEEELKLIEKEGILIHRMDNIVTELSSSKTIIKGASGSDLIDLVLFGKTEK